MATPKFNSDEAHRRLLDMLAGWEEFSRNDAHACNESDDVADLYQDSGAMENPTKEDIEQFVNEKVLPFILTGKKVMLG